MNAARERVLVVTGGLISSTERSLREAARKWLAQWRASSEAWFDVKVKLGFAERIVAARLERRRLTPRRRTADAVVHDFFTHEVPADPPSLTGIVLATLLERAGLEYATLTLDELFARSDERARTLLRDTTCVFLSTTYLHDLSEVEPTVRRLKRDHNRIVLGGALVGALPADWPGMPEVDIVALGHGELLVDSLAAWIRSGYERLDPPPGGELTRREHSRFMRSGQPSSRDLDSLPTPDWGLARGAAGEPPRAIYYESVRGCPFRCAFCNYPFLFDDRRFRVKSAERMLEEWTGYVEELGVEIITCLDSLFTVPRERLHAFCRGLIERRLPVRWICYARPDDLADEGTVELMTAAGAHQVHVGIESGDPAVLGHMNKQCSVEANARALDVCRERGLTTLASLIVGFPGESGASLERTYAFLAAHPPDFHFLATFSTRVAGVPVLTPQSRERFGLRTAGGLHTMAPYWQHATMSCADVGNHVRALDERLARNEVSLNATLFYSGLLEYDRAQRPALLGFQRRAVEGHRLARWFFDRANALVDRRVRADLRRHLPAESESLAGGEHCAGAPT